MSAEPTGALECRWYHRVASTLRQGDRHLSVGHWLWAAVGVHVSWGGDSLGLMALLEGKGYLWAVSTGDRGNAPTAVTTANLCACS